MEIYLKSSLNTSFSVSVALVLGRDGKIYLRASDGLEDWFELLEECISTSKERRKALRYSHEEGKSRNNNNVNNTLDQWMSNRQRIRKDLVTVVAEGGDRRGYFC